MLPPSSSPVPSGCVSFPFEALDTRYAIYIEPPAIARGPADEPHPVLLCLDGDDQFAALQKARAALPATAGAARLLLVGIGYGASYREPANRRVRDYTPVAIEGASGGGGADAFLAMLITAFWPELERRFAIDPHNRGLAGHSLGALFALDTLLRPEPFFHRVLASAPSLWWGDRALFTRLAQRPATAPGSPRRLFLGLGEADSRSMRADLDAFESALAVRPWPGLTITRGRFAHHDHFTAIKPGFRAGLIALYD